MKAGEEVELTAVIEVPPMAGYVTAATWIFERKDEKNGPLELNKEDGGKKANVRAVHTFTKPGVYFPTLKVQSSRTGNLEDIFVQCKNLDRVRVIVEE